MTRQTAFDVLYAQLSPSVLEALAVILETTEIREKVVSANADGDDVYGPDLAGTLGSVAREIHKLS